MIMADDSGRCGRDERNRRIAYRLASVDRLSPAYVRFFGCGEDPRGE